MSSNALTKLRCSRLPPVSTIFATRAGAAQRLQGVRVAGRRYVSVEGPRCPETPQVTLTYYHVDALIFPWNIKTGPG
jgi:hypothetical protein